MTNDHFQVFDAYFTGLFHLLYGIRFWKVGWQIQQSSFGQLWIRDAVATCHGAGKQIPVGSDVLQDWAEAGFGLCRRDPWEAFESEQKNREDDVAKNEAR